MAYALVGTIGAVSVGSASSSVTPAWGTSETRVAGNLLVCWANGYGHSTPLVIPGGWIQATAIGSGPGFAASTLLFRIATGGDTAPTLVPASGQSLTTRLAEFSGGPTQDPLDTVGSSAAGTSGTNTVTCGAKDVAAGELVCYAALMAYSAAAIKTISSAMNNGATDTGVTDAAVSTSNHYAFGFGITTGNTGADTETLTYTATSINGVAIVAASFALTAQARHVQLSRHSPAQRAIGPGRGQF
jgi:hypothetical protein